MGITYEQFLACLPNSASRKLIGVDMTDEEAFQLAGDERAATNYFEVWSATRAVSTSGESGVVAQAPPPAPVERVLLDISTVGRGGEPAKVRVSTERLFISTTGGVSAWKAFLGAATLGLSTAVTGINAGTGGDLDIPVSAVSAAVITKTGLAYSTIKLLIGGDSVEFGLASIACKAVVDTINAAVSGGQRAASAADAWVVYQEGRSKQWPNERLLRKALKKGQITQQQFERDLNIANALLSLAML